MDLIDLIVVAATFLGALAVVAVCAYIIGRRYGRLQEWERCVWIVQNAMIRRGPAGAARWAMNAIYEHRRHLMPEEEFFGTDQRDEDRLH